MFKVVFQGDYGQFETELPFIPPFDGTVVINSIESTIVSIKTYVRGEESYVWIRIKEGRKLT